MVRYANSYIDQLYEAKDMFALDGVIDVVGKERELPEQFWLSKRLFAWLGWGLSGSWQYYEAVTLEDFDAIAAALERFGLAELAGRYRSGMAVWKEPNGCSSLDRWIDAHRHQIQDISFQLIADDRQLLYAES